MSLLLQEMRRTYAAQRGVSQGASITLAAVSGGFQARFECATRASQVLGDRNMRDAILHIPLEDSYKSIMRLAETFSVALVDTVTDDSGTRFVLVWKIVPRAVEMQVVETAVDNSASDKLLKEIFAPENLDEY